MGRISADYEVIFIINPEIGDEATEAAVNRFTNLIEENGGTITEKNEWGKRRLAYPINDFLEGYYVLLNVTVDSQFLLELERIFNITDVILRYLVIKK